MSHLRSNIVNDNLSIDVKRIRRRELLKSLVERSTQPLVKLTSRSPTERNKIQHNRHVDIQALGTTKSFIDTAITSASSDMTTRRINPDNRMEAFTCRASEKESVKGGKARERATL